VVLGLALVLGLGLAEALTRELRPKPAALGSPVRSRLVAVLEGVMAVNVTPAEQDRFRAWVAAGSTREGFARVETIVQNNCGSCHGPGGQYPRITGFEDLQPIALEPAPSGLAELVGPRGWHLGIFPAVFLVLIVGYLRRSRWPRWRILAAASVLAVLFDAGQWWLRQGRPEHLWAPWTAAGALAVAMAALVGIILQDVWGPKAAP
jgi:hypothetical protein